MSREQSWRLGRTITVIVFIMLIISDAANLYSFSATILFLAMIGFALLWRGSTE
jgi:hypothetical protein